MAAAQVSFWVVAALVLLALGLAFLNGFQDAASSMATVVSTGVLKPQQAVLLAAAFNFMALFVLPLGVAATLGKGFVAPEVADHRVVFGALAGALAWSLVSGRLALPFSLSHALLGGLVGAAIAKAGFGALAAWGAWVTLAFVVAAPALALLLGSLLMVGVAWLLRRSPPRRVDNWFRRLQLVSAGLYSLGHGGNDAQKAIGIIWMLLIGSGYAAAGAELPPLWVAWACYMAIALGTLFGGWRIVKTMGQRITKLKPVGGVCAETGAALTLFLATGLGIPVSTTHTITGAIVGVGSTRNASAVRWGVAGNMVWAWIFTIPAAAAIGAAAYALSRWIL